MRQARRKGAKMGILTVVAEGAAPTLDTGAVDQILSLVKSVMGLFTMFPLNIMLVSGLVGIAFAIFRKAKKSAG